MVAKKATAECENLAKARKLAFERTCKLFAVWLGGWLSAAIFNETLLFSMNWPFMLTQRFVEKSFHLFFYNQSYDRIRFVPSNESAGFKDEISKHNETTLFHCALFGVQTFFWWLLKWTAFLFASLLFIIKCSPKNTNDFSWKFVKLKKVRFTKGTSLGNFVWKIARVQCDCHDIKSSFSW